MKNVWVRFCVLLLFFAVSFPATASGITEKPVKDTWPGRVLITNDNGINDIKIIELARAFSKVCETYVVAPLEDRSGTGNYISLGSRKSSVEVEKRDLGPGIVAFGLDGYPADCIFFAARGLLKDKLPDLVVSGINGGPNLGPDWMNSGTIGAARTAAFGGIPAIAVSGLDKRIPGAVSAATQWVVKLAQSPIVKNLKKGQYLTISIPRIPPAEIKGIKIVPRAALQMSAIPTFARAKNVTEDSQRQLWVLNPPAKQVEKPGGDIAAYMENYIVIVPMNVNEVDVHFLPELQKRASDFPAWPPCWGSLLHGP